MDAPASARLDLPLLSEPILEALLDGRHDDASSLLGASVPADWPDAHDAHDASFLRIRLDQLRRDPTVAPWLVRALVLRGSEPEVVGHAGCHGPPGVNGPAKPGAVEVGYTVFPSHRGRGLATEAALALIEWARAEGATGIVASVAPDNAPSLAVVRKLGFVRTGEQWDEEDGLELVFELEP